MNVQVHVSPLRVRLDSADSEFPGGTARGGHGNKSTHSPLATNAVADQGPKNFKMGTAGTDSFASTMIDEYTKKGKPGQGKVGGNRVGPRPMGS